MANYNPGALVKETTGTTGTGSYTLAGAVTGFRAFSDVATAGTEAFVTYFCTDGEGAFEWGVGALTANTTLTRAAIIQSSNAGAAVSWASGTKEIFIPLAAGTGRNNFDANTAANLSHASLPGITTAYGHGSMYAFTAGGRRGLLINAPSSTISYGDGNPKNWIHVGAAEYLLNPAGTVAQYSTDLTSLGNTTDANTDLYGMTVTGYGGVARWPISNVHGSAWGTHQSAAGGHQTTRVDLVRQTTDATPVPMHLGAEDWDTPLTYLPIPVSCAMLFTGRIVARDETSGDVSAWTFSFVVKRASTGDPALVGTPAPVLVAQDAGASTWDVDVSIDTANDGVQIDITGEAATTIRWTASFTVAEVAFT